MGLRNRQTRAALAKLDEDEFAAFLDDVSEIGLQKACDDRVWMIGATLNWIRDDDGRLAWYEGALKVKSEVMAHEIVRIADEGQMVAVGPDGKILYDEDGKPILIETDPSRDKLKIEARKWATAKWHRERYGEKVDVNVSSVGLDTLLTQVEEVRRLRALAKPDEPRVIEGEVIGDARVI